MPVGCATHSYTITDRDGGLVAASGVLTSVAYNRLLNDTSTARIFIGSSGEDCCGDLGAIRSWRHWLNIYRDEDLMWSGPILSVEWTFDQVVVLATDLLGLLDRRVPHSNMTFAGTDLAVIASELITDGLAPDDPGHEITIVAPSGVPGDRTYETDIGQTADHLRDLADTGIDFTVIGNRFIILPDEFCEVVGRLADEDLPEGLTIAEDGASLVTRQIVAGSEDGDVIGSAGGVNDYYGLLELYTEQTTITTDASATASAQAKLAASATVPVFIDTQNVTLAPTANVAVSLLVPGWCLDITSDSTCRRITQRLKITGLTVNETGGTGQVPGREAITVQVAATTDPLEVN